MSKNEPATYSTPLPPDKEQNQIKNTAHILRCFLWYSLFYLEDLDLFDGILLYFSKANGQNAILEDCFDLFFLDGHR